MDISNRQPIDRAALVARVDYAIAHIEQYERDFLGRVPVDLPALKQILRDVSRELRPEGARG